MRNGPIRLRLEARSFLGITNVDSDYSQLLHGGGGFLGKGHKTELRELIKHDVLKRQDRSGKWQAAVTMQATAGFLSRRASATEAPPVDAINATFDSAV